MPHKLNIKTFNRFRILIVNRFCSTLVFYKNMAYSAAVLDCPKGYGSAVLDVRNLRKLITSYT